MKGKTRVETNCDDQRYSDFKKGETGYIDGYLRGGEGRPLAAVVIGDRIKLISLGCLKVVTDVDISEMPTLDGRPKWMRFDTEEDDVRKRDEELNNESKRDSDNRNEYVPF